jgi:hypothetical protein
MATTSLEQKIEILEKKLARQEKEIYDLNAIKEIGDLMAKYEYFHVAGMFSEHAELFAKRDDTIAQVGTWGFYKGWESIRRLYAGVHVELMKPGHYFEHSITTSMTVVAGDGKTAKYVCISPGHETKIDKVTGKAAPGWCWVKYACDFIKMPDNHWYIWHLFVLLTFWVDYNNPDGWGKGGEHRTLNPTSNMPPELRPDAPSLPFHDPYDPKKIHEFLPAFPLPYETYDEKEGVNWIYPHAIRRKEYPHDLEGTQNIWPNKNAWK